MHWCKYHTFLSKISRRYRRTVVRVVGQWQMASNNEVAQLEPTYMFPYALMRESKGVARSSLTEGVPRNGNKDSINDSGTSNPFSFHKRRANVELSSSESWQAIQSSGDQSISERSKS